MHAIDQSKTLQYKPIQAGGTICVNEMFKKLVGGVRFAFKNCSTLCSEKSGRPKQGYDLRLTFFPLF